MANPLVNNYQTSDDRWVALCMLQPDVYWEGVCEVIGREDMLDDPRFATPADRSANGAAIVEELDKTFATKPLSHWLEALARQKGQWDVVRLVSRGGSGPSGSYQRFHPARHLLGRPVSSYRGQPVQFDRAAPPELRPAPEFAEDTDEVLGSVGMDEEAIMQAKISGAVV